jgi:amidase
MADLVFSSTSQLAAAIRARRVSATEALDAHLAQIERHHPALNAVVTLDAERARTRAASGSTTPSSAWFSAQRPERRAA